LLTTGVESDELNRLEWNTNVSSFGIFIITSDGPDQTDRADETTTTTSPSSSHSQHSQHSQHSTIISSEFFKINAVYNTPGPKIALTTTCVDLKFHYFTFLADWIHFGANCVSKASYLYDIHFLRSRAAVGKRHRPSSGLLPVDQKHSKQKSEPAEGAEGVNDKGEVWRRNDELKSSQHPSLSSLSSLSSLKSYNKKTKKNQKSAAGSVRSQNATDTDLSGKNIFNNISFEMKITACMSFLFSLFMCVSVCVCLSLPLFL